MDEIVKVLEDLKQIFADGKISITDIPLLIDAVAHALRALDIFTANKK